MVLVGRKISMRKNVACMSTPNIQISTSILLSSVAM
jgi:hypothetical protein